MPHRVRTGDLSVDESAVRRPVLDARRPVDSYAVQAELVPDQCPFAELLGNLDYFKVQPRRRQAFQVARLAEELKDFGARSRDELLLAYDACAFEFELVGGEIYLRKFWRHRCTSTYETGSKTDVFLRIRS